MPFRYPQRVVQLLGLPRFAIIISAFGKKEEKTRMVKTPPCKIAWLYLSEDGFIPQRIRHKGIPLYLAGQLKIDFRGGYLTRTKSAISVKLQIPCMQMQGTYFVRYQISPAHLFPTSFICTCNVYTLMWKAYREAFCAA